MSAEKIAVIGSNSFSGSHFIQHCLGQGAEVLGISRSPQLARAFLPYRWNGEPEHFHFLQADINTELAKAISSLTEFGPDYVVNFAAQGMVSQSWQNPLDWYRTNTLAMVDLHEQLRKLPHLKAFVQASTPEVYGNTSGFVREDHAYNPSTPYAISKAACDMNLLAYARTYNFPAVLTRSANVCGPGQQMYRILPRTVWAALSGETLTLEGGGLSERAFIHIEDVCRGTLAAARKAEPGSIFHLSTEQTVTIRGLVETVCEAMHKPFSQVAQVGPARIAQDAAYKLDSSKARQELNWAPTKSLTDMIQETIDWVQRFEDDLKVAPKAYHHQP